ncbi:hypothetical protein DPMN_034159 [Dreissena polymorpha]|uniref:Uncharacterized protein n=1 Tax=Dreissena polymorpha TaxID=45954 RepID=A0A9D4M556_DREPO|nr:hypothetical protein DPMN_034159 [Dreissena polymorpha]
MDLYGIRLDRRYYMVLQRLYPLNSACNPIIFMWFSKQLLPCGSPKSSKATRCYESNETTKTTFVQSTLNCLSNVSTKRT